MISVIVSTYNWPAALNLSLLSLMRQSERDFEIVIADDGSRPDTSDLISYFQKQSPIKIIHSWQPDEGFRLAKSRNEAVKKSSGDYLIFVDGDCILPEFFIRRYKSILNENKVVAGPRILLSECYTKELLNNSASLCWESFDSWQGTYKLWKNKKCNRFLTAVNIPLGNVLRDMMAGKRWQQLRGCNWGLSRGDFYAVGGQDESFKGWGLEDSDMAIRLINKKVLLRSVRYAGIPVYHLWHLQSDPKNVEEKKALLMKRLKNKVIFPQIGISCD